MHASIDSYMLVPGILPKIETVALQIKNNNKRLVISFLVLKSILPLRSDYNKNNRKSDSNIESNIHAKYENWHECDKPSQLLFLEKILISQEPFKNMRNISH